MGRWAQKVFMRGGVLGEGSRREDVMVCVEVGGKESRKGREVMEGKGTR